jgi:hypothetical protein
MSKKQLVQISLGNAWFLTTFFGYLVGSLIGYRSGLVCVKRFCSFSYAELKDLECVIEFLLLAVWVAGIYVGIVQLLVWNKLVWLSRRWISVYALGWTGIMLLVFLLFRISNMKTNPIIDPSIPGLLSFLLFCIALLYPIIAGSILLFNSPTKAR